MIRLPEGKTRFSRSDNDMVGGGGHGTSNLDEYSMKDSATAKGSSETLGEHWKHWKHWEHSRETLETAANSSIPPRCGHASSDKNAPLFVDIRRPKGIIRDQESAEIFAILERIRRLSIRLYRKTGASTHAAARPARNLPAMPI